MNNSKNRNTFRTLWSLALSTLGVILILAGLSLLIWIIRPYFTLFLLRGERAALRRKVEIAPTALGNRIVIPSLLVDAPIIEGFTEEILAKGIAHLPDSAKPGEKGNAILAGHNYSAYFIKGNQNLFSLVHLATRNTQVYVFYEGERYIYEVKGKQTLSRDDPRVFAPSKDERLTLVASASSWSTPMVSATKRLVILAKPIEH